MLEYNAIDSAATHQCANAFWREIRDGGHEDIYDFTMRLLEPLMYLQTRGIRVDKGRLDTTQKNNLELINQKQDELNTLCGRSLNPKSSQDCQQYFYIEKRIPPYTKRNSKGESAITTDDKALARIARGTSARRGLPEARLVQELRGLHKLSGTYLEMEFDEDGRFRCACNPRGTTTGRISTGKTVFGTGMNMQNLPPVFKDFLVPDEGYYFLELDKRQAEWVVVAYQCGDANMIKAIEDGTDPHVHTGHLMFDIPKELILKEEEFVGHTTDPTEIARLRKKYIPELSEYPFVPRSMSIRQAGKKSNHGLDYDETYKRFALENEMTEAEAKVIVSKYYNVYPNIRVNYDAIQTQLRKDRTLINCFGRRRKFLEKWGTDLFKAAYAFIPQSTVSDVLNTGIIESYYDTDKQMERFELLAQVHDSILFQVPLTQDVSNTARCIYRIRSSLTPTLSYGGREFQIHTDMKASLISWGQMKTVDIDGTQQQIENNLKAFLDNELKKTQ